MSTRHAARPARQASRRAERKMRAERARQRRRLWLLGGLAAAAVVVAVVVFAGNQGGGDGGDRSFPPVVAAVEVDPSIPSEGRVLGDPHAPVTVIEYGDYQCPGCARVATLVQPRLIADYVATGKVRLEFRDYAFLDRVLSQGSGGEVEVDGDGESVRAAVAASCAANQGEFWRYHDTIYANHDGENEGAYSKERLKAMARVAALDTAAFDACLDNRATLSEVKAMFAAARDDGVTGTPTFFVNGRMVEWKGYDALRAEIDAALAG